MSSTSSSNSSSSSTSSRESESESRSSQVDTSTSRSRVGTSNPQASTLFPRKDALGDIKDEEPTNYSTNLETSVYKGQIRSGYRLPMHPFAVAFLNYYKMGSDQLVPNGWRKLVGLIYLVQTSAYQVAVHDFMRLYLEVCFLKNVARIVGWYYIHNKVRVIKEGPKSNKGWHFSPRTAAWGLIPPTPTAPIASTPVVESLVDLRGRAPELVTGTPSSRTPSKGGKGKLLGLLQKASKGKRKEVAGEGYPPVIKKSRALIPPTPRLVIEDLPIDKDPIFSSKMDDQEGRFWHAELTYLRSTFGS
ncbi:hypothetical protein RJ640_022104 [Escallonia rubra]|uniref:Transposase (putative) gypsy type domain-containing protein n=1 Tax=Escallonia rubra TaxID=112253 RepID=A0AA88UBY5_9ASTE|nr:hypothetical protein RJ640_022104 [Escallonia rubra]